MRAANEYPSATGPPAALRERLLSDPDAAERAAKGLWQNRDRPGLTFGEMLPGVASIDEPKPSSRLGLRSSNCLGRGNMDGWDLLANTTPAELGRLPNFGRKSFLEVVIVLLETWASSRPGHIVLPLGPEETDGAASGSPISDSHGLELFVENLRSLLHWAWREGGAETVEDALNWWGTKTATDAIWATERGLREARLEELADTSPCDEGTWQSVLDLEPRELRVLAGRILPAKPARSSLAALGEEMGLTRERIRQIESAVVKKLDAVLRSPQGEALAHLSARLVRTVGPITDETTLHDTGPALVQSSSDDPGAEDLDLRSALLLHLAGPYVDIGGVLLSPRTVDSFVALRDHLRSLPPGPLSDPELIAQVRSHLDSREDLEPRIIELLGLRRYLDGLLIWHGNQADLAEAILLGFGKPMTMTDLHEAVGFHVNPRSLSARIQGDERFMRRGKDHYGLRSWGGEEYSGIEEELEQAIERAGGAILFEETVAMFVREFGVTENSVRSYAAGRKFIRQGDNLALRPPDDPVAASGGGPIDMVAGAFCIREHWHLRIDLDHDALRGSGRPIRIAVAVTAGLEPDLTFGVDVDGTTVIFSWSSSQPHLGSIRPLLQLHGCTESDLVFLPLQGPEPRTVQVARFSDRSSALGIERFALEVGLDPDDVDPEEHPLAVSSVLGLPAGADWDDIVDRLRDRGEDTLLAWLPEQLT